jgi:hypothetical protein
MQQRIVDGDGEGGLGRQFAKYGAANDGEQVGGRAALAGKEAILRRPVLELESASGQQSGHGMAAQTEQTAQREGLGALGDAALLECGEAVLPELLEGGEDAGRVFFSVGAGG